MFRCFALIVFAVACNVQAQTTPHFTIQLPTSAPSDSVYVTYCLYGAGEFCSWVKAKPGLSEYKIEAAPAGTTASSLKAILYSPGCAVDAFQITLPAPVHTFVCRPLPPVLLTGELTRADSAYPRQVELQATYLAVWANRFFGVKDGPVPSIPLHGPVYIGEDNRFRFLIPDFASDPVTASGAMNIWAKDRATGDRVAILIPAGSKTNINSVEVGHEYPVNRAFVACGVSGTAIRDNIGFALRESEPRCGR